jgi:hypothetical protein
MVSRGIRPNVLDVEPQFPQATLLQHLRIAVLTLHVKQGVMIAR